MAKPSIIVKDLLLKTQDQAAPEGISFALEAREHLAVLGQAGSGKTSLVMAIAGKAHFPGTVTLDFGHTGHPRVALTGQRYDFRNLSGLHDFYYQQRFNSPDASDAPTVLQELLKTFPEGAGRYQAASSARASLELLGILHLQHAPLIQLSSGEHRKFQLAKALLCPPQLLILDTPYTGLDISSVHNLNNLLSGISQKGTQVIMIPGTFPVPDFITHIACLKNNELAFFGDKKDFDPETQISSGETTSLYDPLLLPVSDQPPGLRPVVEMKNISLTYGNHTILQNLNWRVMEGEKWLLKGPNGAGKSSLLSMITGDHPQAYSNDISLFGLRRGSGESIWDIKKKTGYISPELHACFDKNMTCYQAIGSGYTDAIGLFSKLNPEQIQNVLQWLDFLQLSHVQKKPLHSVPASLQRMVLLGRALVKNPPLLVLDEPCQGLDLKQSLRLSSLVDRICAGSSKTLIYVSHDESNIPSCVQKVLELEKEKYTRYSIPKQTSLAVA
jgi:molybdate transport system ATP-binding protein